MSAREQALPTALEEAVQGMAGRAWIDPGAEAHVLDRLRAAWPAVRRELLAEAQPEPATEVDPEVEQVWQEFWRSIVAPDGTLDLEQIKRELYDYRVVMRGAAKVYEHVTGGQVSKPNTDPGVVCSLADDHYEELSREFEPAPATAERVKAMLDLLFLCRGSDCSGFTGHHHRVDCAAYWRQKTGIDAAFRRLHFGAAAWEARNRRALAELWTMYKTAASHEEATVKAGALVGSALAQPPSEPAAALEALLGELRKTGPRHVYERLRKALSWEER